VIGTVNVDETTYMFSPKVLDRANVIELRANEEQMKQHLMSGKPVADTKGFSRPIDFLAVAKQMVVEDPDIQNAAVVPKLSEAVRTAAAGHLLKLFKIMKKGRFAFGFRTNKEVMAYLRASHLLAHDQKAWALVKGVDGATEDGAWKDALDEQILMKILPKLHGSRSRLGPLLGALCTYCAAGKYKEAMQHFPEKGNLPERGLEEASAENGSAFKGSRNKLREMIDVVQDEQFVSFIC